MAKELEISEPAKLAVQLAVMSAGPIDKGWRGRVQAAVPVMAALVRDDFSYWGRDAENVMRADVFKATYLRHELDDRNGRLNVWLEGEDNPMRTWQINTPPGAHMKERLDRLQPGTEILVWKYLEPMQGRSGQKSRLLVHYEIKRSTPAEATSHPRSPGHPPGRDEEPPVSDPSSGHASRPDDGSDPTEIDQLFERLDSKQRAKVARRCRGEGIDNFMRPAADQELAVIDIIRQVRNESS